jgi:hypothetical protein
MMPALCNDVFDGFYTMRTLEPRGLLRYSEFSIISLGNNVAVKALSYKPKGRGFWTR